ncbi:hypothetical protein M407DRAFT_242582 [Tulasnella calospora MUT 4182]|uniref:Uncharacterized protein n=1 Tax=Tulasnella calospora MUT 4182 TaxID=1051891 RepID=A0A0C3QPX1_9AGAM|nr:hypothetical protein M407DRAFT_242582 [Tulasnella calospora MUT 4182]
MDEENSSHVHFTQRRDLVQLPNHPPTANDDPSKPLADLLELQVSSVSFRPMTGLEFISSHTIRSSANTSAAIFTTPPQPVTQYVLRGARLTGRVGGYGS